MGLLWNFYRKDRLEGSSGNRVTDNLLDWNWFQQRKSNCFFFKSWERTFSKFIFEISVFSSFSKFWKNFDSNFYFYEIFNGFAFQKSTRSRPNQRYNVFFFLIFLQFRFHVHGKFFSAKKKTERKFYLKYYFDHVLKRWQGTHLECFLYVARKKNVITLSTF